MDACVIEVADDPETLKYKERTDTLDSSVFSSDDASYSFVNDKLFREAERNPDSWLSKKIHSSTTVLASNYLVRHLNVASSTLYFVKK